MSMRVEVMLDKEYHISNADHERRIPVAFPTTRRKLLCRAL